MGSSNISANTRATQTVQARYSPERRRAERRNSDTTRSSNSFELNRVQPPMRRRSDSAGAIAMTARKRRNNDRRGEINDLQAEVEQRLGWAGVHAIRGWSGLGAGAGTIAAMGTLFLSAAVPMFPGAGIVAFLAVYLLVTGIGALMQYVARRNRLHLVADHKQALLLLRDNLVNTKEPDDFDSRQRGEEEAQLEAINRLLHDIDGGFWYGIRCASAGFMDPIVMFREGWRHVFGNRRKQQRRKSDVNGKPL